jgi:hypothetical protein
MESDRHPLDRRGAIFRDCLPRGIASRGIAMIRSSTDADSRDKDHGAGSAADARPDERLSREIADRMIAHRELDVSGVTVSVHDARVVLDGWVPERWMRYIVDDIAESPVGVEHVQNNLTVRQVPWTDSTRAGLEGGRRQ